ncbi:MAG: histidine triad nucleotide-binding protein [Streptosporangiaceae bacterium]
MPDCLFCKIVTGDLPADRVLESKRTIAFRDIDPQAPVHVLVIPREHLPDIAAVAQADGGLLDEIADQARQVAADAGITDYRVVFNTGAGAGQTVWHAHAHVLGGRPMTWPPG